MPNLAAINQPTLKSILCSTEGTMLLTYYSTPEGVYKRRTPHGRHQSEAFNFRGLFDWGGDGGPSINLPGALRL